MTNDAAVARDFYERLYGMTFRLFLDANGEPDDDNGIELRLAATVGEKALFETADHSALVPATTVAELRDEILELKAQLAREEHDHGTTIDSRDRAEEALSDVFMAVTGREAEWSSAWGFADAIQEVEEHMLALTKE